MKDRHRLLDNLRQELRHLPPGLLTRFAPSPTGYLHLGHAASAVFVWGVAQAIQGKVLLRIEDHDRQRSRPEFEQTILEDLDWLGLQASPSSPDSQQTSQYRQSAHPERYRRAIEQLQTQNALYACRCSRKTIQERQGSDSSDELFYDGHCRLLQLPRDEAGLRVKFAETSFSFDDLWLGSHRQIPAQQCGDLLLRDREGQWTYNFAVTVDDACDQIDLVIRGQDLLEACGRQLQLRQMLEVNRPLKFLHHPLLLATPEQKLSKRFGSPALKTLRHEGVKPELVLGRAAQAAGLIDTVCEISAHELGELFR